MKRDSLVFAISGTFFGLMVGWILGSQQAGPRVAAPAASQAANSSQPPAQQPPPLDVQKAADLERQANARPGDAAVRAELGNVYYDAERFDQAIPWYEASLKIDPRNVSVSTDLAICYYYTNNPDRALTQIDHSLSLDGKHVKTLLNQGIIRAWGKQDIDGAIQSWQKVVDIAPTSEEAKRAQQAIDGLKSGHPTLGGAGGSGGANRP
jgi:cytochrome c-type biogenesis protein CcmH/NrfG